MGNYSTLSIGDKDLLFAEYRVPAFWLACLDAETVRNEPLDEMALVEGITHLFFRVDANAALARFRTRAEALEGVLGDVAQHVAAWEGRLMMLGKATLRFDVGEVVWMDDDGEKQLAEAIRFLDEPSEAGASAFLRLTSIAEIIRPDRQPLSVSEQGLSLHEYLYGDPRA